MWSLAVSLPGPCLAPMSRPLLGFTAATAVALLLAWLWLGRTPAPTETLTLAIGSTGFALPYWIAEERGYFADEGLAVRLRPYPIGKLALAGMLRGEADLASSAETPVVFAALRGEDLRIVASYATSSEHQLIARMDRGILHIADLRGRRVGLTLGSSADYFLEVLLTDNGLTRAEVSLTDLPGAEQVAALAAGEVDALATFAPFTDLSADMLGANGKRFPAGLRYVGYANLVARPAFAAEHKEALRRLLRATERAILWLREHPDAAVASWATRSNLPADLIAASLESMRFNLGLDQGLMVLLEAQARWAIDSGLVPGATPPDFLRLIDATALSELHPGSVTLIGAP